MALTSDDIREIKTELSKLRSDMNQMKCKLNEVDDKLISLQSISGKKCVTEVATIVHHSALGERQWHETELDQKTEITKHPSANESVWKCKEELEPLALANGHCSKSESKAVKEKPMNIGKREAEGGLVSMEDRLNARAMYASGVRDISKGKDKERKVEARKVTWCWRPRLMLFLMLIWMAALGYFHWGNDIDWHIRIYDKLCYIEEHLQNLTQFNFTGI